MDNQTASAPWIVCTNWCQPSRLLPLASGLAVSELVLHPVVLAISMANLALLCSTRILHPNLRCILVAQSASIVLNECTRVGSALNKFAQADMFAPTPFTFKLLNVFAVMCHNFIGHVLLVERVCASLFSRNYEYFASKWFTASWTFVVICVAASDAVTSTASWNVSLFTVISVIAFASLSLAEWAVMGVVGAHNWRKYNAILPNLQLYSLSQKFQLSENIRTCRQLSPAFVCHFLCNLVVLAIDLVEYFGQIQQTELISLFLSVMFILNALLTTVIEITVITHHPALKQRFWRMLARFAIFCRRSNRIEDSASDTGQNGEETGPKNLQGGQLIRNSEIDAHFRMLQTAWK